MNAFKPMAMLSSQLLARSCDHSPEASSSQTLSSSVATPSSIATSITCPWPERVRSATEGMRDQLLKVWAMPWRWSVSEPTPPLDTKSRNPRLTVPLHETRVVAEVVTTFSSFQVP